MGERMYFGVRGNMRWIKMPRIDMAAPRVGWGSKSQYLNGGAGVRGSVGAHYEYVMSWGGGRDEMRPIFDYANGIYDTQEGVNLIYFLDPTVMDKNVLPALWASPFQQVVDGLTLFPSQKPKLVSTDVNSYDYPARSATYISNGPSRSLWVPIPPGYTAWVGVHGLAEGDAGITVATTYGLTSSTATLLETLPVDTDQRFSASYAASGSVDGILLTLADNGPASTDLFTWSGTIVQLIRTGQSPEILGSFISGDGHSGCQFDGKPTKMVRQAKGGALGDGRLDVSAQLVETGSWL